jgi:hypothetical protein
LLRGPGTARECCTALARLALAGGGGFQEQCTSTVPT